ncbi:DUF4328 domain-containing protein [Streptosporangium sp. NPDC050280]|uniref:DUF4328 domain-containing protein n=1 Tax=unclassified Streptosporangium TaxID=2632669 RepID=UPI00342339F4
MRSIPSLQKSASAVYVTLTALVVAVAALAVFEQVRGRRLVLEISELNGDPHAPGADAVFGAVTVFAILIMFFAASAIAAVAAYLNWLLRARQGADRTAVAPVLVSWFVPVVNLAAPPVLVDRLWRASRPPLDRRLRWKALLTAWWLSWLVASALVLARLWPGAPQGGASLTGFGLTELVAVATASLLCATTVRQITGIQAAGGGHRRRTRPERRLPAQAAETVPVKPTSVQQDQVQQDRVKRNPVRSVPTPLADDPAPSLSEAPSPEVSGQEQPQEVHPAGQ